MASMGDGSSSRTGDWADESRSGELRPHRVFEGGLGVDEFESNERAARAHRFQRILFWGGLAYLAFLPIDALFGRASATGEALPFVLTRLAGAVPLFGCWLWLVRGARPSRATLFVLELLGMSSMALVFAVMVLLSGGLASPVLFGLIPLLVGRGVGMPDRWQNSLVLTVVPAVVFWLVVFGGRWLSIGATPAAEGMILANLIVQLQVTAVTVGMVTFGSHAAWNLRRNLFHARRVGRYELLRPLGRGGMGEVWVAWHSGLRQEVALKVLPLIRGDEPRRARAVARFEREVLATSKLRHPNTVRVYDFGLSADGCWYYAMELLEGENLAELVRRDGPLPVSRALALLDQAARALAEAHAQGVVHRDIKPENLFVSHPAGERDVLKVLDFGVATVAAEAVEVRANEMADALSQAQTEPGTGDSDTPAVVDERGTIGTPLTIAPEVAAGGVADARSDVYGLGCVLYFMLTGRPVFIDRRVTELLRAHIEREPRPPSQLLADPLPDYVETLVMRCLNKQPDQRYADGAALARAVALCGRLAANDRRRGAGEARPRLRSGQLQLAALVQDLPTDTDMSLD